VVRQARPYRRSDADLVPMAWYAPWTPTEREFEHLFLQVAEAKGWTHRYHTHDSRRSTPGFPDWVLVHPVQRRVLFVELKGFAGQASDEQRDWLGTLDAAGAEAYLVSTTNDYARDVAAFGELLSRRPRRVGAT
jgi:hypothetical protein